MTEHRTTYNKPFPSEGAAHLEIAHLISTGELTADRAPRPEAYENREGKKRWKITVKAK